MIFLSRRDVLFPCEMLLKFVVNVVVNNNEDIILYLIRIYIR